jgi:D-alanyl-lipoteichoic acid acyltransferase DltB (MBOAT superfamily)
MLFNSIAYAIFLPVVLALYLIVGRVSLRAQNLLLLLASYLFYGWWDWRFLCLLIASSVVDYWVGIGLKAAIKETHRRGLLIASLTVNLGTLGFFKYYNFFVTSLIDAFAQLGISLHAPTLKIILQVGVSFYTFQALTYTISVYRKRIEAERDPIKFLAYVAFFPQLVAGPIERAGRLLPQFARPRHVSPAQFTDGLRQIAWGLFCKIVVADNCAGIVNAIFASQEHIIGSVALTGAFFFAFQIYGDFSGYSHIAIGSARLLGFELMQNFATPYFSQSVPEFWHRWHISLSTWFRDYLFIPLGGSRVGKARQVFNILVTFTVSGIWHGANWTFIAWGFLNGLYYLPKILIGEPLERLTTSRIAVVRMTGIGFRMALTFFLTLLAWVLFRAKDLHQATIFISSIFSPSLFVNPGVTLRSMGVLTPAAFSLIGIAFMVTLEWVQRNKRFALEVDDRSLPLRWAAYASVATLVLVLRYTGTPLDFIYFQF